MEVSGVIFRSIPSISGVGVGIDAQSHKSLSKLCFPGSSIVAGCRFSGKNRITCHRDWRVFVKPRKASGFSDEGHLNYYSSNMVRCGGVKEKEKELECKEKKMKKKLKLLKGLSKNISMFSDMGYVLDPDHGLADQVKGQMISEAADMLLAQMQQLKAEKKEIKRQRKEEKSKLKALRMQKKLECKGDSSSSSESSDSKCGEIVEMSTLKTGSILVNDQQPLSQESVITLPNISNMVEEQTIGVCNSQISSTENYVSNVMEESSKKIEVCMGGKCKKLGAAALLDEFQKAVGGEGSVVGCKCMGKCKSAPNVKVLNSIDGTKAEIVDDDSVRTPANPLYIGVGLEDVGAIVSNFFRGNDQKDLGLAAAAAS